MKREICFVSPKFSDHIGGMETHAYEFAKGFVHDVDYPLRKILIRDYVTDGVEAPAREVQDSLNGSNSTHHSIEGLVEKSLTGNFPEDSARMIDGYDLRRTLFYFNSPTWLPAAAQIKKHYPQAKVVVRSGGNDFMAGWIGSEDDSDAPLEDSRRALIELINNLSDVLIVNSSYSARRAASVGIPEQKIVTILGGVDCNAFYPCSRDQKEITIFTAARLIPFKGLLYSIRAVQKAADQSPLEVRYDILGDGPQRAELEDIGQTLLGDRFKILGSRRIEQVPDYYRKADIFLHLPVHLEKKERGSSYIHTETMGRSLCEAAASGLPVIASDVGGIPEVVMTGRTGYLVAERDVEAASMALLRLIQQQDLRNKMGTAARRHAQVHFDWNVIFSKYKEVFDNI